MGKFLTEELKHFDVKREVLERDAGHQIVAAARRPGADLITMPTHGLSVFRRYILDSITAKVLHDAECAIRTGTHMEYAPPLDAIEFPKVLCAVDFGPQSERALQNTHLLLLSESTLFVIARKSVGLEKNMPFWM